MKAIVFQSVFGGFILREVPSERPLASGSLEACFAAGLLITGDRVRRAGLWDEGVLQMKEQEDRAVFGSDV